MRLIPVKPTSRQAIWETVRELRTLLGVENDLYFNIVNFVEKVLTDSFGASLRKCTSGGAIAPLKKGVSV